MDAKRHARNIRINLLDKKFKISGVSTVGELQLRVQRKSGVDPLKQGHVMFGDKRLSPTDVLSEVGVVDGAQLDLVPATSAKIGATTSSESRTTWNQLVSFAAACFDETRRLGKKRWKNDVPQTMMDLMFLVQKVVRSPIFQKYMTDPKELYAQIEIMRQFAQAVSFSTKMPLSMQEALKDPDAWRKLTLWYMEDIKNLDLDGAAGEQMLQNFRELQASGMLIPLPPNFYDFMTDSGDFSEDDN